MAVDLATAAAVRATEMRIPPTPEVEDGVGADPLGGNPAVRIESERVGMKRKGVERSIGARALRMVVVLIILS